MKQKIKLRVLAWILIVSFIVSGATPVSAKADVVEDFTPRRIMIKRDETAGEDYSVSFFARYEPAEETVITEGLTVMDAGMYDLYDLYFDQSVVAVEDDAPLFATGEIVAEADRLMELTGIDSLQEQGYYGYGVKVAVLDTAVEKINGIHLAGEVSFISEEQQKVESGEPLLHGTAVASVLSELVPMAELYSVEVLDETGNGYYSSLIQGIYWAVEQNMDVLVLSLGGETYSAFLQEALQLAAWHDIVVLAAAGNEDGGTILYPAAYQEVLSVGAADSVGQPIISYAGGTTPDLLAPGETGVTADNRAMVFRGSSAATPVAAAGAVLLRSMDSALSREQVMALLLNTSDTIVDIEAAVENRTSPVYARLTNRTASAELLAGQEEALDGVLEAQSTDSHICSFNTTYGPHTANGHQCIITCRYCDFLVIQGGVYLADCESCVSNPSSPDVTPEPTPEPTPTPLPVRYDTTLVNGTLGGEDTANTTSNGDPVNMVTGNFYLDITDMYYQGIGDAAIAITRHYNSVDTRSGLLGKGWRFAYESKLTKKTGGDMEAVYGSGRTILFDKKGSSYIAPDACRDTLIKNADGTWCLVTEDKLTYTYSSAGKLTAITDRNGNSVTLTYSSGTLTGITGADGITLSVTCSGGKLRKITDPYGRTVEYSYDSKGRLIKVSGETCGTMTYTYNSYGITSITDGNGETYIKNKYDSMGRVIRQTDADGRQYKFQYNDDAQENTFIVVDSGSVTRYRYDENLYITRINYDDGSYERFYYDADGNRTAVRARSGYMTRYTYDGDGNVTAITDALGNKYRLSYDADGNLVKAVSPLNSEVRFSYDGNGNLTIISVLLDDGTWAETRYIYDNKGRVLSVTDAEGGTAFFTYGAGSQPLSAVNALGGTITYTYDEIGRRTAIETEIGKTVYEYSRQDQIVSITAPDGGVTRFVYDAIGNLTKLVLPEQVEEAVAEGLSMEEAKGYTYTYDSMDRIIASGTPEQAVSKLGYDIEGNVTEQGMPEYAGYTVEDEKAYRYTYDGVGNMIRMTAPDGGITTYDYDAAGNVTSVTYPDGQKNKASVDYTYDALGRVTRVTDTLGQIQYRYTYDADGNLTSVTDAMGYTTWYKYSVNGLLLEVRVPKKEVNGQVWYQIYKYTYDKNGQAVSAASSAEFVTETGLPAEWDTVTYTYDAAGNVTSVCDSAGGEVQYLYDAYSRLLEQKIINGVTDPVATAYTYNNMGHVTESEGYKYTYDLNGNLTVVQLPEGGEVRYFYDEADRLVRTEEDVQVDTLTLQDNSVLLRPLEVNWEGADGTGSLYPESSFTCEVVVKPEETAKSIALELHYEDALLELYSFTTLENGVSVDTSIPGVIKINSSRTISRGETALCELTFTAKEAVTGTAYVAISPESTITTYDGIFLFSECTGILMEVCLPDYNEDGLTDLRDFTLLAKQHGITEDDEEFESRYDITGNGSINNRDLDYLKKLLFAGIPEAESLETDRVADRRLQPVYTVTSKTETRVTTYEYNAADQVTKVTDCNGNSVYYDYDSCGRLVKLTDQAGYSTEISYDKAGNPVRVVMPEGVTESYTYNTNGSLLKVTDALGGVTSYSYDAYGRAVAVTDAVGVKTEYRYDIAGNVVKNLFTGEIYCYNAYDELVSYTDAEGNETAVQYDTQGNITSTKDAHGNSTSYTYRKDGLLTEIKDASGAVTLYEYNSKGLVSKETDALGAVTTYEYDSENRPVKLTTPDGTVTEYSYNSDGSVTRVTAVKADGEAEKLRCLYALDGSLTASISSTDILEYSYDKRGYVASVIKNGTHEMELDYNGNGSLVLLKEKEAGAHTYNSMTGYTYDARGDLSEVRTGGTTIYKTAAYDREGIPVLAEVMKDGELLAAYVNRADGLLEQVTDGAGNVTVYQYDRSKQVTGLTITSVDGTVLYSEKNTYDKNGSLTAQVVSGNGYATEQLFYTYDVLDRLISETNNGRTTSYTYDVMGNRLTKTADGVTTSYVYDLCNKLLSEETDGITTEYAYDGIGNLIEKTGAEGTTTYAYDALNHLAEVVNPDGTWQRSTYDATGIRSMVAEGGVTTEFVTLNGLVVAGYNKKGEQTEHYFYGTSLLAAEYAAFDTTAGSEQETSRYYYLKNSHGDVIGLTDITGSLTQTYGYDAFGTLTSIQSLNAEGVLAEAETALSRFLYAGEQYDAVTGLYYLRARQYDTVVGRFTQEDTYLGDGRNLYVYVQNNPLKYVDPSGYCSKKLGYAINSLQNAGEPREIITITSSRYSNSDEKKTRIEVFVEELKENSASATNDFCTGFFYEIGLIFTHGMYHDSEAEKVVYQESFQYGVDFADFMLALPYYLSMPLGYERIEQNYPYYDPYYDPYYVSYGGNYNQESGYVLTPMNGVTDAVIAGEYQIVPIPDPVTGIGYIGGNLSDNILKSGKKIVDVNGKMVTLDNSTFDPNFVDGQGRTNIQRMEQGLAPIGVDGKSVNIHHIDQTDAGPVMEITATEHQQNYGRLHTNVGQASSQINRGKFNNWRKNYWEWRSENLE